MLMNTRRYSAGWCQVSLRLNCSSAGALHLMQRFGNSASFVITSTESFRQTVFRLCVGGGKYGCCGIIQNSSGKLSREGLGVRGKDVINSPVHLAGNAERGSRKN